MSIALSRKDAISRAKNLTVPEQILKSISQVFQDAQLTYVGHRKHLTVLKTIQKRAFVLGFEDVFNMSFCKLINKVLPIKKSETVGDRIIKLVANFVSSIQADDEKSEQEKNKDAEDKEEAENEDGDTLGSRFVNHFVHHLLRGIESKDKNVRYRVMHFLSLIMNGLGEIDEELYSTLIWEIHKRLSDKEPTVRLKAVLCLSRFQEEDVSLDDPNSAVAKLLFVIQNDPSAEVRRAALLNLDKTEITLPYLMERAKDTNSVNRKLVYSRIIKEIGDFRLLERDVREKVLTWGLKDREPAVQQAAIKMFCTQWFENVNHDLMELLERLHLSKSKISEIAMRFFLENRPDVVSKIQLDEDFWRKLNVEASFLARLFHAHCLANNNNEKIETNFPETAEFASLLTKYLKVRKSSITETGDDSERSNDINFVIEQLLIIAKNYDFGDEVGRREMLQALRLSLYDELTDSQIKVALEVLKKISINEKDFCQMVSEIIIDIRDEDEEFTMDMDMDLETEDEGQKTIFKAKINRALQCLSICQHMLEITHEPLRDNIPVTSLLDSVINPSIRSKIVPIREGGVKCLGLCCLLDEVLATEQLAFFGICCAKGNDELQATCLKIIFDILSTHGPKVLDVEGCVDTLSMHKLLFRSLRKIDRPQVQAITAEGLCKLYLNDIFNDEELFETLVLAYFSAGNSRNEDLIQALSFCLPVYAFSHPKHQEKLAQVAADAFSRLYTAYEEYLESEDTGATMSTPTTILQQLIHWTDPEYLVNCSDEVKQKLTHHYEFALNLLELVGGDNVAKGFRKAVCTNLNKLLISEELSYVELDALYDKAIFAKDEVEAASVDSATLNGILRFISNLEEICNIAEEREKNQPTEKDNDEEFVHALTSNDANNGNDSKEEHLEAGFGEADAEDLAIPETSLRKISSNQSAIMELSDDEKDDDNRKGKENEDILDDKAFQSANEQDIDEDDGFNVSGKQEDNPQIDEPENVKGEMHIDEPEDCKDAMQFDDTEASVNVEDSALKNGKKQNKKSAFAKSNKKQKSKKIKDGKNASVKAKEESDNDVTADISHQNATENEDDDDSSIVYMDSDGEDEKRVVKKPNLRQRRTRALRRVTYNEEPNEDSIEIEEISYQSKEESDYSGSDADVTMD